VNAKVGSEDVRTFHQKFPTMLVTWGSHNCQYLEVSYLSHSKKLDVLKHAGDYNRFWKNLCGNHGVKASKIAFLLEFS
jgi:hypothetical protein